MHQNSLLHDVLRPQGVDQLTRKLQNANLRTSPPSSEKDDSDDELVGVTSIPGTPLRSRPSSRPVSPTRASSRPAPGPLLLSTSKGPTSDPLRAFPTELGQRIFALLDIKDLARCSRVSKKWNRSQTINYVWFQHYRKENFHDENLPPGKWTRRESKQNWRTMYLATAAIREKEVTSYYTPTYDTPSRSRTPTGTQTPREVREERWKAEAAAKTRPDKVEMREIYKELGGRKVRGKGRLGFVGATGGGSRDRGGWDGGGEDW
ncbi:hypothetical protein SISNIDRAFT_475365 [Sistotremastrum niveocremeum HHB9708]|uniref:F-box domain-containing protein n=2 Tax=Sistotremastraceae TaxID=3402574 RepID=A0A164R3A8_9AGAM|nr:hypothetical protein SISNIDRAFT_475365 [Sistotremastrum niveocremeum HHB9708]KZT35458.1 hypothetical protein SISSUDRAFT_1064493 [Sistotremastrum suecicum HHB10207 ss-3]